MSPATSDTGNTRHSTPSTPRFCTRLVTSLGGHCVGLPLVLPHVGMDKLDHVCPDGGLENGREGCGLVSWLAIVTKHRDHRSCRLTEENVIL